MKSLLTGLLLGLFAVCVSAQLPPPPTTITLSWDIPTQREDDSPLPIEEIAGYEITNSCAPDKYVIPDASTTSYQLPVTLPFDCEFAISAVDKDGIRSPPSDPLRVNFNAPAAPTFNAIQIN